MNVGFMAVLCPEGHSDIRFVYHTPMLSLGAGVTVAAFAVFAVYAIAEAYDPERGRVRWFRRFVSRVRSMKKI